MKQGMPKGATSTVTIGETVVGLCLLRLWCLPSYCFCAVALCGAVEKGQAPTSVQGCFLAYSAKDQLYSL